MTFSRELLVALSNWQNGWGEVQERREEYAAILKPLCQSLPIKFREVNQPCYRKRFLHRGELVDIIMNDMKSEGVTSWTVNEKYAEMFKGLFKENAVAGAIFSHKPEPAEVLVNFVALWNDPEFTEAAKKFQVDDPGGARALFHFGATQSEVVLEVPLKGSEIIALTGVSSPFDELCDIAGTPEVDRPKILQQLIDEGVYPGEPRYAPKGSAPGIIVNVYNEMRGILAQHGINMPPKR